MAESVLSAENICKAFGANEVLRGISFQVHQGEVLSVIWPLRFGKVHSSAVQHATGKGGFRQDSLRRPSNGRRRKRGKSPIQSSPCPAANPAAVWVGFSEFQFISSFLRPAEYNRSPDPGGKTFSRGSSGNSPQPS